MQFQLKQKNDLDSQVAGHFGKCPFFTFVEIEDGKIKSHQIIDNPYFSGHEVGQVPCFIKESAADVMISGGMGWSRHPILQRIWHWCLYRRPRHHRRNHPKLPQQQPQRSCPLC